MFKDETLLEQIKDNFAPEKVILFGSYAKGHAIPKSDIDICVVMDTDNKRKTTTELYYTIDHPLPIIFCFTLLLSGMNVLLILPASLTKLIEKESSCMPDSKRYMDWVGKADSDLKSALILFEHEGDYGIVAFHCQQTIEKLLKHFY